MTTITTEPTEETRTRFIVSYAFDVSKYADFAVYADDEEHAERIAKALLDSGTLARLLDYNAQEYDNGTDNLRVFTAGDEDEDEMHQTLPEIAKEAGEKLPWNWQNPAAPKTKPERPSYAALTEALRLLTADCIAYTNSDDAELPDTADAVALLAQIDAAAE